MGATVRHVFEVKTRVATTKGLPSRNLDGEPKILVLTINQTDKSGDKRCQITSTVE